MWNCRMRSQQFLPIHVGQVEPCFGAATLQPNSCSSYSFRCTVCQLKKLFNRSVQLSPLGECLFPSFLMDSSSSFSSLR